MMTSTSALRFLAATTFLCAFAAPALAFDVDLDPARFYVSYHMADGTSSGDILVTASNTISHPLILPCDVTEYGAQVDVRYLTAGDPVYPQLQSRLYIIPNTLIWSSGYSNLYHFSVVASNLIELLPLNTQTDGQVAFSSINQFRDYLPQPTDLPANQTVRHSLHVTLYSDPNYSVEVTDGTPRNNNLSFYIRRACPN